MFCFVTVWMNDTVLSTTQTEAQVKIMVFSLSVISLYDNMNTLTSSPELQSSFHQLFTISFETIVLQHTTYNLV